MSLNQELVKSVKQLVADDMNAVDFESGLCRFCNRVVEAYDEDDIQGHRSNCSWLKVRKLVEQM
jgi:hypothetical protein